MSFLKAALVAALFFLGNSAFAQTPAPATPAPPIHIPNETEMLAERDRLLLEMAADYPPAQRAKVVGVMQKHFPAGELNDMRAQILQNFTAQEIKRIETEPGFTENPSVADRIQQATLMAYGWGAQKMLIATMELHSAGIYPLNKE